MPDMHQGYGFPVGGVAATELPDGVVSPGGIGYDINCGVRLLALPLAEPRSRRSPRADRARALARRPGRRGARTRRSSLAEAELDDVLRDGPRALVARGIGAEEDLERTESRRPARRAPTRGGLASAPRARRAASSGRSGSGNHFVEVQRVDAVFDERRRAAFGLRRARSRC